jgi:hypothetical protein
LNERLQIVVNGLGAYDLAWQPGMPFAWLRLPQGWRASTFTRLAEEEGVLIRSADQYAMIHGRAPNAVRLAVVGNIPRAQLQAGIASLARLGLPLSLPSKVVGVFAQAVVTRGESLMPISPRLAVRGWCPGCLMILTGRSLQLNVWRLILRLLAIDLGGSIRRACLFCLLRQKAWA